MSTEEKPIDYVMEEEKIQEKCREIVYAGLKNYANSDDYKLLAQYDPSLAATIVKPNLTLEFGAAPLMQAIKFKGLAWGERYHYASDNTRIVDAKIRAPFETDPYIFLLNYDKVSRSTLSTAMQFYGMFDEGMRISNVIDYSEKERKKILKGAGEEALEKMVDGWSNVYTSIDGNTDVDYIEYTQKKYLYVNPVYAVIPDKKNQKKVKKVEIGYIGTKNSIEFYPHSLGQEVKQKTEEAKHKNKTAKAVISTIVTLGVAIAIVLFILLK